MLRSDYLSSSPPLCCFFVRLLHAYPSLAVRLLANPAKRLLPDFKPHLAALLLGSVLPPFLVSRLKHST